VALKITLEEGGPTLDWSRNCRIADDGLFFRESDRRCVSSDQVNYDYFREHIEDYIGEVSVSSRKRGTI
jgi:hypothetical protein